MRRAVDATQKLLDVNGLAVSYAARGKSFTAVEDVSLSVSAGEILGIVGESGAGKSTVADAVTQLIESPGEISAGSIRLGGVELVGKPELELCSIRAKMIGSIFQEPLTALSPVMTIGKQLQRSMHLSTDIRAKAELTRRASRLMESVGISNPDRRLAQYPHQLSGGMRQRIVIAMALAGEPQLLIADEPTTALDVSIQSEILQLIRHLCVERNLGVILITHDMAVVNEVADRIVIMRQGRVIEAGETASIINDPEQPYTRALIFAVPRTDRKLPRFRLLDHDKHIHTGSVATVCKSDFHSASTAGVLFKLDHVCKRYVLEKALLHRNTKYMTALDDVSFSVNRGDVFGLVGESGSGKTTIARILCGLESADSGNVFYKGVDITGQRHDRTLRSIVSDIQMVFQDPYSSLNPRHRIFDALAEPLKVHRNLDADRIRNMVINILGKVGMNSATANRYSHQFSGGQRQRICIARALLMQPAMLICDEPTSSLDVAIQAQILNLLKDLREELSLTVLFVSHDLAVIRQMCDRVAVLRNGRICEVSDSEQLFESPRHDYTKQLLERMPRFSTSFDAH